MKKQRAESREGMVVTTIALDPGLHHRLAIAAVEERSAMTELVRQAVAEWLTRRDVKTKRKGSR
jgi:predicted transcriptional regulator